MAGSIVHPRPNQSSRAATAAARTTIFRSRGALHPGGSSRCIYKCLVAVLCGLGLLGADARSAFAWWPLPAGGPSASGAPELILTFDDGPHEKYTPQILDELDSRGLQAIFFWVGYRVAKKGRGLAKRRAVLRRAIRDGHIVGNHTVNHWNLCKLRHKRMVWELDRNVSLLERRTKIPVTLFRSPFGAKCRKLQKALRERRIDHMHWDIDPQEWRAPTDDKKAAAYVIHRLKRLRGRAVLLMHDTHPATARALPVILDWIDKENAKRRKRRADKRRGLQPIRIVAASDWVSETKDVFVGTWAAGAASAAARRLGSAIGGLVP